MFIYFSLRLRCALGSEMHCLNSRDLRERPLCNKNLSIVPISKKLFSRLPISNLLMVAHMSYALEERLQCYVLNGRNTGDLGVLCDLGLQSKAVFLTLVSTGVWLPVASACGSQRVNSLVPVLFSWFTEI